MIGYLEGQLVDPQPGGCVVVAHGVGYEVLLPAMLAAKLSRLSETERTTRLFIHTHVREDVLSLYGFEDTRSKELFRELLSVSGVGPRTALAMVGVMEPEVLIQAITSHDVKRLSGVPGVGKKTAERICLDLQDKLSRSKSSVQASKIGAAALAAPSAEGITQILVGLGYKQPEAIKAAQRACEAHSTETSTEVLLRAALGFLA